MSVLIVSIRIRNLKINNDPVIGKALPELFQADNPDIMQSHIQALNGSPASFELDIADRILYCFIEPLHDIGIIRLE